MYADVGGSPIQMTIGWKDTPQINEVISCTFHYCRFSSLAVDTSEILRVEGWNLKQPPGMYETFFK